jgi:tRNA dimethylallyltransferase
MIVVLGPTATGKTQFSAHLAARFNGEVISADSRQVYRGMDQGTGKDYDDYLVDGVKIPYHLVDIVDPGYEYNVFEFRNDFIAAFNSIISRGKTPVLCGGTGLYLEAVLLGYELVNVPVNRQLRDDLANKTQDELNQILSQVTPLHNTTDLTHRERTIRAIEIAMSENQSPGSSHQKLPEFTPIIFGLHFERAEIRARITERLKKRLESGMTDEVVKLLQSGLNAEQLMFYGLEYKYLTLFVTGKISYVEMFSHLNTAIHQFAKRQMTWFRRMEKRGTNIHWIDGWLRMEEKVKMAERLVQSA